jgi:hypothetical protein
MTAVAVRSFLKETGPEFERTTGHRIEMQIDLAPDFKRQFDAGEVSDVAIFSAPTLDLVVKETKTKAETPHQF